MHLMVWAGLEIRMSLAEGLQYRFGGIGRVYGMAALEQITHSHVAIIGLGGVGSWAAEALVRSGLGKITLVDFDDICVSNTNRQIQALGSTVGKMKTRVLGERFLDINPELNVQILEERFDSSTASSILARDINFVIDATDGYHEKALLIAKCLSLDIGVVTVGGSAGRRDPRAIESSDLAKSHGDRLLQKTRKELRVNYGLGLGSRKFGVSCVFSPELPYFPDDRGCATRNPILRPSKKLDCSSGMGSVVTVTASFGLFAASIALEGLTKAPQRNNK